jgi:hypothetical protein
VVGGKQKAKHKEYNMKLKFVSGCELEVIDDFSNDNINESHMELFKQGTIIDVDVIDDEPASLYFQLQFPNGSVITCVAKDLFEVVG